MEADGFDSLGGHWETNMSWAVEKYAGRNPEVTGTSIPMTGHERIGTLVSHDGRDWLVESRGWQGKRLPATGRCDVVELFHPGRSEVAIWDFRFGEWYDPIRDDPGKEDPLHDQCNGNPRTI